MTRFKALGGALALSLFATTPQVAVARDWHGGHDKVGNTILGAGLGMLGGALLSDGDPWATLAGGAAGGAIGNGVFDNHHGHRGWGDHDGRNGWRDHGGNPWSQGGGNNDWRQGGGYGRPGGDRAPDGSPFGQPHN